MSPGELDARRDGLALVECMHRQDLDGVRCLLDHADLRPVAVFLAAVCGDLLADLAGWLHEDDLAPLFAKLRSYHADPGAV